MNTHDTSPPHDLSRRRFFKRAGLAGAALSTGALLTGSPQAKAGGTETDIAILNFALNLEYLEAEFYLYAATGAGLDAAGVDVSGSGTPGGVTIKANSKVPFASVAFREYADEIAKDEKNHVVALRAAIQALGGVPAARPAIDLQNSFNTLANAAGIAPTFDPFAGDVAFLLGAFIFEDVGVTAYHGAAPLITHKHVLSAAAGILSAESSHSAIVRTSLFSQITHSTLDIAGITQAISDLRDALDGPGNKDQHLLDPRGKANLAVLDANGIAFSRTTREVLNIVYGAQNASKGLFFPAGLNGQITT